MQSWWTNETHNEKGGGYIMGILTAIVVSTIPFKVRFDGEETASSRIYKRLESYNPTIGDKVVFIHQGSLYLCMGKVV